MNSPIDRQDAIDIVIFECGEWTGLAKEIAEQIQRLPSAEREIIYCKDCKRHNLSVEDVWDYPSLKWCPLVAYRGKAQGHEFDYQYCVYAERKEDER